jgi:hypothetical protein
VTSDAPVEDFEVRNGAIRAGDQALKMQAFRSEFEELTVDGHALALAVTGDKNDFENIVGGSAFHTLDISGDDLKFEGNTVSIHPSEQLGSIHGDRNEVERNSFRNCGSSALDVQGNDVEVERNVLLGCPLFVAGTGTEIERNEVTLASDTGINVFDPQAQVTRNIAANNSGSGIKLYDAGALVARNTANDNGEWGIEAVPGTIDGGGNRASGNGQAGQCLNLVCSP